jgi:release factor glutamine methyltransferase
LVVTSESAIVAKLRAAGCVFAEAEARVLIAAGRTPADIAAMVDRRVAGLPLEHVVGWAEFCGLRIVVGPGVFVPRRRSEFLVGQAVAALTDAGRMVSNDMGTGPVVLDLCCGSGAVGLAVAVALRGADKHGADKHGADQHRADQHGADQHGVELHAADIDPGATAHARRNLAAVGGHVHVGNLYDALPADLRGRIDVIVVNAPYVPTAEIGLMPAEARLHEPLVALDGGTDGVGIHRLVAAQAPQWLAPGGWLLIETSERQAALTEAAMATVGLKTSIATDDDLDATVVIGHK